MSNQFDVIVVGGGTGGVLAAVAAARENLSVLLIEQYGFLGGTATAGGLCNMASFYYKDEQVVGCLPQEFMDRLVAMGGSTPHLRALRPYGSGYYAALYNRELYKYLSMVMAEEAGVHVLLHTYLTDVICEGNLVTGVVTVNKSGRQEFYAKVIIDATGDCDVAYKAGAECTKGNEKGQIQPGSLMFDLGNVDIDKLHDYVKANLDDFDVKTEQIPINSVIPDGIQKRQFVAQGFYSTFREKAISGEVYTEKESITFTTTALPSVISMNASRVHFDPTIAEEKSKAAFEGHKQAYSISQFLIKYIPGFENAFLLDSGMEIGFRESRHIVGEYTLSEQEVQAGEHFSDVIARYGFPCDVHKETKGSYYNDLDKSIKTVEGLWINNKDAYDLPYRCLVPKDINGLLVIGKGISVTHVAHGSTRLMPLVMAEGQAAGIAAKLAIESQKDVREIDIPTLQKMLLDRGAILYRDEEKRKKELENARKAITEFIENNDSLNSIDDVEWFD